METHQLKIWGIVQGVGFRPFLTKLARECDITGWVLNEGGYVAAVISGQPSKIEAFRGLLKSRLPEPAEIVHWEWTRLEYEEFQGFEIRESGQGDDGVVMLPADLSVCPSCIAEFREKENRRYRHPFISCMECGPRYSIIDRVPYDRPNTAMIDFPMCANCEAEYSDGIDRRYHAQTVSCHDCGPVVQWKVRTGDLWVEKATGEFGITAAIEALNNGEIIGIKGIGGFHLAARVDRPEALRNLREMKGREEKPFAIMFPNRRKIEEFCVVSEIESGLLEGKEKPIVLLEIRGEKLSEFPYDVSRSSRLIGAFLPYTSLQVLLLEETGPLVMTSGNLSDEPIITDESGTETLSERGLKYLLTHERAIRTGEDDSVMRVTAGRGRMIRRSRGFVPVPLFMDSRQMAGAEMGKGTQLLCTGGDLKNTFALTKGPFVYLSQYLGDLSDLLISEKYEYNISRMEEMLRIQPEAVVVDLHPRYFSTSVGKKISEKNYLPYIEVQHHHSHIASVIAEHGLNGTVLGLAFDGTGFGTDGKIWGSEFLLCEGADFSRIAHLEYTPMVGGDSSAKEGWKTAFAYGHFHGISADRIIQKEFPAGKMEWSLLTKAMDSNINRIENSSMGRFFDGVSYLLGICDLSRYEGDAAIRLENAAYHHWKVEKSRGYEPAYVPFQWRLQQNQRPIQIGIGDVLRDLLDGKEGGTTKEELAWRFHCTIADMGVQVAKLCREETGVDTVALSGGVFANELLLRILWEQLETAGFRVYSNEKVPGNDGGISLGQAYIGGLIIERDRG